MRNGFPFALAALVLGTGLATAQGPRLGKPMTLAQPLASQPPVMIVDGGDAPPPSGAVFADIAPTSCPSCAAAHGGGVLPYSAYAHGDEDGPPPLGAPAPTGGNGPCGVPACGPDGCYWASAEYLLWWTRSMHVPPLVTQSPAGGANGVLGPGTTVLLGDENIKQGVTSGGRFTLGVWLNDTHSCGLDGNYLFLGEHAKNATFAGNGAPGSAVLARPFFNVNSMREDAELVSFPGLLAGSVHVRTSNRLAGGEINALRNVCCDACYRIDVFAGFRYFEMHDGLSIDENLAVLPGVNVIATNQFSLFDSFDTTNKFYGVNLGFKGEARLGNFFTEFAAKVAIGGVQEVVTINGATNIFAPGAGLVLVAPGGLLTQTTNIGRHTHQTFAYLPEGTVNIGYQVCKSTRVFVGGNFLYLSRAARSGDQIDRALNPTLIPVNGLAANVVGPLRPSFTFRDTDFWAAGAQVGLEFRY